MDEGGIRQSSLRMAVPAVDQHLAGGWTEAQAILRCGVGFTTRELDVLIIARLQQLDIIIAAVRAFRAAAVGSFRVG